MDRARAAYGRCPGAAPAAARTGPDGHFDFSTVEGRLRALLAEDPDALFHLRIYMEMGEWWNTLYPGEREIADDGTPLNQSYASTVWRDAGEGVPRGVRGAPARRSGCWTR